MIHFSFTLFGTFQVMLNGQAVIRFPTDKIRALLVYLLLHADQPLRRDRLTGLLWADLPQKAARHNLRQSLYRLRRTFDAIEPNASDKLLTMTRQTVQLHSEFVESDLQQMERFLATAVNGTEHIEAYAEAVALYQGEFLAGFSLSDSGTFEEWLMMQREVWAQQILQTLHTLTQFYEQQGRMAQITTFAARQIELEPLRESAYRSLMMAAAKQGQRNKALAYYEACRQLLMAELGIEPSAETTDLYEQIKAESLTEQTLGLFASQLPIVTTSLIGRNGELAEVSQRLQAADCRLLTLLGPGGIGKTSLAVALAHQPAWEAVFPDGRFFIPLAGVTSPDFLLAAIGRGMRLSFSGQRPEKTQLWDYCRAKKALLILDNFEHLITGATLLAELTAVAPDLKILITSRESLNIKNEQRLLLTGLSYPFPHLNPPPKGEEDFSEGDDYSAVELFVQAGRRVQPNFEATVENETAIIQICQLVQGNPLAIEFAAAWLRLMDCDQIVAEIKRNLSFLASSQRDVPERHQSMLAVFEQSWQLLTPSEQIALSQLAHFRGGFTLDAALTITEATMADLVSLLDKSLLQRHGNGRYALHELLRQFGLQKAETEQLSLATVIQQHSEYYLTFVQERETAVFGVDSQKTLNQIQQALHNIHLAWQTAVSSHAWEALQTSVEGLSNYYLLVGPLPEAKALFKQTLTQMKTPVMSNVELADTSPMIQGYLIEKLAVIDLRQGRYPEATETAQKLLRLGKQWQNRAMEMRARIILGRLQQFSGQYEDALAYYETAVSFFADTTHKDKQTQLINLIGIIYFLQSKYDDALAQHQQALTINRELGNRIYQATILSDMGNVHVARSDADQALTCYQQALQIDRQSAHREGIARNLHNMGRIYWRQGNYEAALPSLQEALAIAEQLGIRRGVALCLGLIGSIHYGLEQMDQAIQYYQRALKINREMGLKLSIAHNLGNLGNIYVVQSQYNKAKQHHKEALQLTEEIGHTEGIAHHLGNLAALYKDQAESEKALAFFDRAIKIQREIDGKHSLCFVLNHKAELLLSLNQLADASLLATEGLQIATQINRPDMILMGNELLDKLGVDER